MYIKRTVGLLGGLWTSTVQFSNVPKICCTSSSFPDTGGGGMVGSPHSDAGSCVQALEPWVFSGFHHGSTLLWGQHFLRRFFCEACTHCSNLNNFHQACGVHTLMGVLGVRHGLLHHRETHLRQSHAPAVQGAFESVRL